MNFFHTHWFEFVFFISGFFGFLAHYLKQYVQENTTVHIVDWWTKDLDKTISAIMVYVMASVTALSTDVVHIDSNLWAVVYAGLLSGYASDTVNGNKKE